MRSFRTVPWYSDAYYEALLATPVVDAVEAPGLVRGRVEVQTSEPWLVRLMALLYRSLRVW